MIARQPCIAIRFAAVKAEIAVPTEQLAVIQRRNGVNIRPLELTAHGDDGVDFHLRSRSGHAAISAVQRKMVLSRRPRHHIAAVKANRRLPRDPLNRFSGDIQSEY